MSRAAAELASFAEDDVGDIRDVRRAVDDGARMAAIESSADRDRVRAEVRAQLRTVRELTTGDGGHLFALFIDLDGLKQLNDTYGHAAGDDALRQLAESLRRCTRDGDLVALHCSVGMALSDETTTGVSALLRAADQALYRAKAAGRDKAAW